MSLDRGQTLAAEAEDISSEGETPTSSTLSSSFQSNFKKL